MKRLNLRIAALAWLAVASQSFAAEPFVPQFTAVDASSDRQQCDTPTLPQAEAERVRPSDDKPIRLASEKLAVTLSATRPVVLGYQMSDGRSLPGDCSGDPLRVRIYRSAGDQYRTICLREATCFSFREQAGETRYAVKVGDEGSQAASFDIVFRLEGAVLRIGVENVNEQPGYLLMDVLLPQVVAACGPAGQLVVPTQSGRLVPLGRSAPGRHVIGMNWFEMDLCGAVVGDGLAGAVRTRDWDNELEAQIAGAPGHLTGGYAVRLALRAEAQGNAAKVRLAQSPSVEVAIVKGEGGRPVTWVDAAKWLRHDVKGTPNPIYDDTYIYKIFCDSPGDADYTTFDDAVEVIRKVHALAPWLKQVVYLVGWQYRGHDTGYPATDKFNARLGGIDGLRRAAAEAAKYNAVLSYHDNFDDAYRDSPQWDESIIARSSQGGGLKTGGLWAGGRSYIMAFQKYAQKAGMDRVRRTVAQMPVRESYHIDVLSAVPMRRDFNLAAPENTRDSLEGKFAIVREFNRHKIDVTSEGFTAPFVGVIGHAWHFWRNSEPIFAGEEPVPFVAMIYHGGPTTYGRGNHDADYTPESALDGSAFARRTIIDGATFSTDWTKHATPHALAEPIYLVVAPWTYLRTRKMQDFQRQGDLCRVTYDANTFVEVNKATAQWRVVVDGVPVIENDLAVIRKGNLVAVYAQTARRASIDLPAYLRGRPLRVTNACTGEDVTGRAEVASERVSLDLPAREPVLIEIKK